MTVRIVGDTSLISHKFSAKAKMKMLSKQKGEIQGPREVKDPQADFLASLHEIPGKRNVYGFPAGGFKLSCMFAGSFIEGLSKNKNLIRGGLRILGGPGDLIELIHPVTGRPAEPKIREDDVRVGMTTDLRYRGEFHEWAAILKVSYNADVLAPAHVVNIINQAGHTSGVGSWRPSSGRPGNHGLFHVEAN